MPSKPKQPFAMPLMFAPWVFVVIVAVLAYHVVKLVDQGTFKDGSDANQEYFRAAGLNECLAKLPADMPVKASQISNCLSSAQTTAQIFDASSKPRIEELKWLLTIIGTLGGFFAIAQAASAWFSAQIYTKQAEDGLKAISGVQEAIRSRYPLFDHVEVIRKEAVEALNNVFSSASKAPDSWAGNVEALDWGDNLFRQLGVEARQKLLSVESFASMDLDPAFSSEEHAEVLRKFSLFYRAKFLYEDNLAGGAFCDLERAEAYLILASKKKPDFTIKNDLGSLYGTIAGALHKNNPNDQKVFRDYLLKAETSFRESLTIEPNQQRAHYSLAVILGLHRKEYDAAVEELTLALQRGAWQRERSDYMQTIMCYNMACYKSRQAQHSRKDGAFVQMSQAHSVISYLEKATSLSYVRKELVSADFEKADGDFTGLLRVASTEVVEKLNELRATLEKNADAAKAKTQSGEAPLTLGGAIAGAAQMLLKAMSKSTTKA